jgi:putative phage-type endonuclease
MEQQGSNWLLWRSQGIGSSDIASILGISPWKSAHELFKERTGEVKAVDISNQYQVQRGVVNEPRARALYELISGSKFEPALHVHSEYSFMRVSLDGDDGETVLEIKVPGVKTLEDAKKGIVPEYYMCQVQYQMMCAGRNKAVFFCFHPEQDDYAIVDVKPDIELQEKIKNAVINFWDMVQKKEWREETDFIEVKDSKFSKIESEYIEAKKALKLAEEKLDQIEKEVLKFSNLHKKEVRGSFIKIVKSEVKGLVEYKKIPQLKGVDLEQFRKPSTVRTSIKALSDKGAE